MEGKKGGGQKGRGAFGLEARFGPAGRGGTGAPNRERTSKKGSIEKKDPHSLRKNDSQKNNKVFRAKQKDPASSDEKFRIGEGREKKKLVNEQRSLPH